MLKSTRARLAFDYDKSQPTNLTSMEHQRCNITILFRHIRKITIKYRVIMYKY